MRQQECNCLEGASDVILARNERHIAFLDAEIHETKKQIDRHIDNHPD